MFFQPSLKLKELAGFLEFSRGQLAQPQTDPEWPWLAELVFDFQRPAIQGIERLGPILARMYVRAIRQMKPVGKDH
jgi:hypothetical protein